MTDRRAARLAEVVATLIATYDEWATCWEAEKSSRAQLLDQLIESGSSASAAESRANALNVRLAAETVRVGQDIKALEAERDYLMFAIEHQLPA